MDANEQKLKVLNMLQEGTISQSEALELLELIGAEMTAKKGTSPTPPPPAKPEVRRQPPEHEPIKLTIPESPIDFMGESHQTFSASADVYTDVIETLKLVGKNSKISIRTHQHSTILIEGRYKPVRNGDPMIRFEEQGGSYALNYNYHAVSYMGFDVSVPENLIRWFYVENSNAEITLAGVATTELNVATKNAGLKLRSIQSEVIVASTKNGNIELNEAEATKIELGTTNAEINVRNVKANYAELFTTNASVVSDCNQIIATNLRTKNANIWLDLTMLDVDADVQYMIDGQTTNGNIDVLLPYTEDFPYKINANTKRGRIRTKGSELLVIASDKGYLDGKTVHYNVSATKLDLVLQTTNADININK